MSEHTPLTEAEIEARMFVAGDVRDVLAEATGLSPGDCNRVAWQIVDALAARTATATADTVPWGACTGASDCPERWHVHGCFADRGQCDDPTDHAATADTGLRERVEALEHIVVMLERGERVPYWAIVEARAALDATAAPTTDTGARDE